MLSEWLQNRRKPLAIVCDIDDTICHSFDQPIEAACAVLRQIGTNIEVFYVTSRPEEAKSFTEEFIEKHLLPGCKNLKLCPVWKSSRKHKVEVTAEIACEFDVILCIGDGDEDEYASLESRITFVRVVRGDEENAWNEADSLIRSR